MIARALHRAAARHAYKRSQRFGAYEDVVDLVDLTSDSDVGPLGPVGLMGLIGPRDVVDLTSDSDDEPIVRRSVSRRVALARSPHSPDSPDSAYSFDDDAPLAKRKPVSPWPRSTSVSRPSVSRPSVSTEPRAEPPDDDDAPLARRREFLRARGARESSSSSRVGVSAPHESSSSSRSSRSVRPDVLDDDDAPLRLRLHRREHAARVQRELEQRVAEEAAQEAERAKKAEEAVKAEEAERALGAERGRDTRDTSKPREPKMTRPDDLDDVCAYYRTTRLSESEIRRARELIARTWVASSPSRRADFDALTRADLDYLFDLYDDHFFAGAFRRKIRALGNELEMLPSKMLSKTAGRCAYDPQRKKRRCVYTIEIATKILRDAFADGRAGTSAGTGAAPIYPIGGLLCRSRLECMQLTLEHEMIHLLMFVWQHCNDPVGKRKTRRLVNDGLVVGGHGKTFKRLILHIFGHTAIYHGLFTSVSVDEAGNIVRPAGAVRLALGLR